MAPGKKRILCISYDGEPLHTRQMLLEEAGFNVTPATGFGEAMELCEDNPKFDLIVMGHLMTHEEKTALISTLRQNRDAPILSIHSHDDPPLPEADFFVKVYDGPEGLVSAITSAVANKLESIEAKIPQDRLSGQTRRTATQRLEC